MQVDPGMEERIEEWQRYREQRDFAAKLEKLKLEQVVSQELQKVLEEQAAREKEELLREMARLGGESDGDWLFYCDAVGIHRREEKQ